MIAERRIENIQQHKTESPGSRGGDLFVRQEAAGNIRCQRHIRKIIFRIAQLPGFRFRCLGAARIRDRLAEWLHTAGWRYETPTGGAVADTRLRATGPQGRSASGPPFLARSRRCRHRTGKLWSCVAAAPRSSECLLSYLDCAEPSVRLRPMSPIFVAGPNVRSGSILLKNSENEHRRKWGFCGCRADCADHRHRHSIALAAR
jgi:hypothetical protein